MIEISRTFNSTKTKSSRTGTKLHNVQNGNSSASVSKGNEKYSEHSAKDCQTTEATSSFPEASDKKSSRNGATSRKLNGSQNRTELQDTKHPNVPKEKPPVKIVTKEGVKYSAVTTKPLSTVSKFKEPEHPAKKNVRKPKKAKSGQNPNISQSLSTGNTPTQSQITDYFRRSSRRMAAQSKAEHQVLMEQRIIDGVEDGLKIELLGDKGRGIIATKSFQKGDYVVEYYGELISVPEAKRREHEYGKDLSVGCYMLYFMFKDRRLCVDATSESGRLGRLVNHSRNGNCASKCIVFPQDSVASKSVSKNSRPSSPDEKPRVILVATRDIKVGEEVMYDYGDRSPDSIASHPWLAK